MRIMLFVVIGLLSACAPTPFATGNEIAPPSGCTAAHSRGVNC